MIETLTEEERKEAACTSYAYFLLSSSNNSGDDNILMMTKMAMRMARRHLIAEKGDRKKALLRMKDNLSYRKEKRFNDIRCAFYTNTDKNIDDAVLQFQSSIRSQIESEMSKQTMVVRGFDKKNRAILIKFPRTDTNTDEEAYLNSHIYMMERALACTEYASSGLEENVVVAMDYANYKSSDLPPYHIIKKLIVEMQKLYPERLAYFVIMDAPFVYRGLWKIIKPFVDPDTIQKVKFVTGDAQKLEVLGPLLSEDQAMPFMLPGGKLTSPIDTKHFLRNVPFHSTAEKHKM